MRSSNGGNPAGSKNSGDNDDHDDDNDDDDDVDDVCVGKDDNALYTATQCDPGSSLSS